MGEQWPPLRGIPAKSRYKKARDLEWGETPFDDLDRGELLRLVQAYHAAAVSADSALALCDTQNGCPFWSMEGTGGSARARLRFLIERAGDGLGNQASERIYRNFFRTAYGLLFPSLKREFDDWGVDDKTGEMFSPCEPDGVSPLNGNKLRPLNWRDLLPNRDSGSHPEGENGEAG